MSQLRSLSLHLLTTANYIALDLPLPPPPEKRIALPVLTRLKFRGIAEYLEGLVAGIDAPRLGDIEVTLSNEYISDPSVLSAFIDRTEMQRSHLRAEILSSERAISVSITQPEASTRLELQVSCEPLSQQFSCLAEICDGLSAFLRGVERLRIISTQPPRGQDDSDDEEWAQLIYPFRGATSVHVASEYSTNILHALRLSYKLLPALHKLYIAQPRPRRAHLREAVASFMTSRRLSGHSVAVECHISEMHGTGIVYLALVPHAYLF
ncbi:hypothetical protein EDB87DRAFT_1628567 [Lactarius vividus]|nr:hypothetical protein EDB87DRAFT_1628567 [Lactarius vividus]